MLLPLRIAVVASSYQATATMTARTRTQFPRLERRGTRFVVQRGLCYASDLCYGGYEEADLRSLSADSGPRISAGA